MDSDDDGFAKQGGEALDIGDDFDSEEEVDDPVPSSTANAMPQSKNVASGSANKGPDGEGAKNPQVKGQKVDNQPFDLAVDVNDSEEIESDEEDDEVNVDVNVQHSATAAQKQAQQPG